jgi:hypothetical protein
MFSFISKKISDKKFCTWDIISDYLLVANYCDNFFVVKGGNTRSNMSFIHARAYMFVKHERSCVGPKTLQTCPRIQKVRQTSQPGFA